MADLITSNELLATLPDLATRADLAALIAAGSLAVEQYCLRTFAQGSRTVTFRRTLPARTLYLPDTPVASITSVTVNGTALVSGDWTVDPETGELWRGAYPSFRYWSGHRCPIVVVYVAGFATVPADVKRACIHWIADLVDDPGRIVSEKLGDYQYQLGPGPSGGITPVVAALCAPYRRGFVL